ncbi:MAG: SIR2 family protein [Candidatus Saccharibacteria bacterium]|nr:SIR2 family protein [Microbacteriaceae bacterium]
MDIPHVFVTLGDITHVECDAWMLPSDIRYSVTGGWLAAVPTLRDHITESRADEFARGETLATPILRWDESLPLPILTAVPLNGLRTSDDLKELGDAVRDFVRVGAEQARKRKPQPRRTKHLLAMPSFGTAGGGGQLKRGEVLQVLLDNAQSASVEYDVDVVIVLREERMFALAQQLRKRMPTWEALDDALLNTAKELAVKARDGKLVPFMGAGVSVSAGGPTWGELIRALAVGIGLVQSDVDSLVNSKHGALDQAAYLRERYRQERPQLVDGGFGEAVAKAVQLDRYGLAPALLASLRTEQAITLNYDILFELAARDAGDERTVIPSDGAASASDKWLLKLHGSVSRPDSIVLTRDDYLGYSANREALSAIVKANLITHHLLFVGFGLADDHFHQIIHDVRRALPEYGRNEFATALTMRHDPLEKMLWNGQLKLVPMGPADGEVPTAGRLLEIFLDALLAYATDSHSYLLHKDFDSSLEKDERELRRKVLAFTSTIEAQERAVPAWGVIERMLEALGGDQVEAVRG